MFRAIRNMCSPTGSPADVPFKVLFAIDVESHRSSALPKKNFRVNKRWAPSASRLKQPPRAKQLADDNSRFIINTETTQKDRQVLLIGFEIPCCSFHQTYLVGITLSLFFN